MRPCVKRKSRANRGGLGSICYSCARGTQGRWIRSEDRTGVGAAILSRGTVGHSPVSQSPDHRSGTSSRSALRSLATGCRGPLVLGKVVLLSKMIGGQNHKTAGPGWRSHHFAPNHSTLISPPLFSHPCPSVEPSSPSADGGSTTDCTDGTDRRKRGAKEGGASAADGAGARGRRGQGRGGPSCTAQVSPTRTRR